MCSQQSQRIVLNAARPTTLVNWSFRCLWQKKHIVSHFVTYYSTCRNQPWIQMDRVTADTSKCFEIAKTLNLSWNPIWQLYSFCTSSKKSFTGSRHKNIFKCMNIFPTKANCVTRASFQLLRSWVALSLKLCQSVCEALVTPDQISALFNV